MTRASSIRLTSALLALVWITAPLASVFHGLAEVHRYCAEHRGFEEAAEATPADGRAADHDRVAQGTYSEDHQTCAFQAVGRSDQTLHGPDLHGAPVPELAPVAPVSPEAPRLADVLASAPKTSPPHLAA